MEKVAGPFCFNHQLSYLIALITLKTKPGVCVSMSNYWKVFESTGILLVIHIDLGQSSTTLCSLLKPEVLMLTWRQRTDEIG